MSRTTITVSVETKKLLDSLRGKKSWDEFLRELAELARREQKRKALMELKKLVTKEDIEALEKIMDKVKIKWCFKTFTA